MNKDHIKSYWEAQAQAYGDSHWASWGDNWMIALEIETIGKHLKAGDRVLDIGCANGFAALQHAESKPIATITGVDYAANMIVEARKALGKKRYEVECEFLEGDVRSLQFEDDTFDVAYTTRVLINLPTWEQQVKGIHECIRVVKPNGIIVLSEGFWEPLMLLNSFRKLCGLQPLVEHDFNRYLKLETLRTFLDAGNYEYTIDDFSSIYYLGSRFLRELVTNVSQYPGFSNPVNEMFYEMEKEYSGGGMGIQQAVVIRKRHRSELD